MNTKNRTIEDALLIAKTISVLESLCNQVEHLEWLREHDNGPIPSEVAADVVERAKSLLEEMKTL